MELNANYVLNLKIPTLKLENWTIHGVTSIEIIHTKKKATRRFGNIFALRLSASFFFFFLAT